MDLAPKFTNVIVSKFEFLPDLALRDGIQYSSKEGKRRLRRGQPRIASGSVRWQVVLSFDVQSNLNRCDGQTARGLQPMTSLFGWQSPMFPDAEKAFLPGLAPLHADLILQCQHDQVSVFGSRAVRQQRMKSIVLYDV
jgi:hypothetical protein